MTLNKIETASEFNETVKAFCRKSKTVTNCFLMAGEIEALAEEGRIFVCENEQWLLILVRRCGFSNLYYYAVEGADTAFVKAFISLAEEKELYLDCVSRFGRGDKATVGRLIEDGVAEKYKTYKRMQLPLKMLNEGDISIRLPNGYTLCKENCNYEDVARLWKDYLDEKSTPLPDEAEVKRLCSEGCFFTASDEKGELASVAMLTVSLKQGLIQHLVVSKKHRRQGLAAALMNECIIKAKEKELTALRLWVDCENISAISLYDRLGFADDGMICEQLYMKGC